MQKAKFEARTAFLAQLALKMRDFRHFQIFNFASTLILKSSRLTRSQFLRRVDVEELSHFVLIGGLHVGRLLHVAPERKEKRKN